MKIEWRKVTWYSKLLAVIVFFATFIIAFDLGVLWEQTYIEMALFQTAGSPENPSRQPVSGGSGAPCGGFIRNAPVCASGFHCKLGRVADKGGICVPD